MNTDAHRQYEAITYPMGLIDDSQPIFKIRRDAAEIRVDCSSEEPQN